MTFLTWTPYETKKVEHNKYTNTWFMFDSSFSFLFWSFDPTYELENYIFVILFKCPQTNRSQMEMNV